MPPEMMMDFLITVDNNNFWRKYYFWKRKTLIILLRLDLLKYDVKTEYVKFWYDQNLTLLYPVFGVPKRPRVICLNDYPCIDINISLLPKLLIFSWFFRRFYIFISLKVEIWTLHLSISIINYIFSGLKHHRILCVLLYIPR